MVTRDWYEKFQPRNKASRLAINVVCAVNDNVISKMEGADLLTAPALVDEELAEVCEVLDGLRSPVRPDYDPMCWCVFPSNAFKTAQHEAKCQRARALYEKLRTDK